MTPSHEKSARPRAAFLPVDGPLDLATSLASGQCFRWRVDDRGRWVGVLERDVVRLAAVDGGLLIESAPTPPEEMTEAVAAYFRLDDDLGAAQERIGWDERVRAGIAAYPGMRVLRQAPWEMLASFILSSTSNIPRISRTVELLASTLGERVGLGDAERFTFPGPERIAEAGEARLRELGCGFRAPYLARAAEAAASGGLPLASLRQASYDDALASLVALHGVGEKIADCVMLFSLEKMEAFPADRWVIKALHEWYGLPENAKYGAMRAWAWERFGADAGYANQYLFWNVRQSTRPLRSTATIELDGVSSRP